MLDKNQLSWQLQLIKQLPGCAFVPLWRSLKSTIVGLRQFQVTLLTQTKSKMIWTFLAGNDPFVPAAPLNRGARRCTAARLRPRLTPEACWQTRDSPQSGSLMSDETVGRHLRCSLIICAFRLEEIVSLPQLTHWACVFQRG